MMFAAVVQVSSVAGQVPRGSWHGGLRREILVGVPRLAVSSGCRVSSTTHQSSTIAVHSKLQILLNTLT